MPSRQLPGFHLRGGWSPGEDDWGQEMNDNLLATSIHLHLSFIDFVASLPASPQEGDTYIVNTGPDTNKVHVYYSGSWILYEPFEGMAAWCQNQDTAYVFDGTAWKAWVDDKIAAGLQSGVQWDNISGKPSSAPADIDDAVAKRHAHQDTDADIHDAVAKRHEHGQPLADIDDAALKRHTHANKALLDGLSKDADGTMLSDGSPVKTNWEDVINGPSSSPAQIDSAVSNSHTHQDTDADIHDAVTKRHQHGQPLADIDDAAMKRHGHGMPLADIDDAALKRHIHGQPLADIDDAALKRHTHAKTDAEISDAVDKRHTHANKAVLDLFDQRNEQPTYAGKYLALVEPATVSIYVAPDTSSMQAGDWQTPGWQGVVEAYDYAVSKLSTNPAVIRIYLRPGVYTANASFQPVHPSGARAEIRAISYPTLPAISDYTFTDPAADAQTLRNAYPTRIEFDSWSILYARDGQAVDIRGVLFESKNPGNGTAMRASGNATIVATRVSTINCGYAFYGDFGGALKAYDGMHVIGGSTGSPRAVGAAYAGMMYIRQGDTSQNRSVVFAHLYEPVNCNHGSTVYLHKGNAAYDDIHMQKMDRNAINIGNGSSGVIYGVKVRDGLRFLYIDRSTASVSTCDVSNTTKQIVYAVRGSMTILYNLKFPDDSHPDIARTVYARSNSVNDCNKSSFTGGTPIYSPTLGNVGNKGAYNL